VIEGIGLDMVEVGRLRGAVERRGDRFLRRVFTPAEVESCGDGASRYERLAARFAAKEAVLKALGTGMRGVSLVEVEVEPDAYGRPHVRLHGRARRVADSRGISERRTGRGMRA